MKLSSLSNEEEGEVTVTVERGRRRSYRHCRTRKKEKLSSLSNEEEGEVIVTVEQGRRRSYRHCRTRKKEKLSSLAVLFKELFERSIYVTLDNSTHDKPAQKNFFRLDHSLSSLFSSQFFIFLLCYVSALHQLSFKLASPLTLCFKLS